MDGRIRVSLKADAPEPVPQREEIPRIVRLLALAHRWHRLIDEGEVENQAEIARLMNLTRARVSQIMALRWLCPVVQEWMVAGEETGLTSRALRQITRSLVWTNQREIANGFRP